MPKFRKKHSEEVVEAEQFIKGKPLPFNDRGPVVCLCDNGWYVSTVRGPRDYLEFGDWVILEPGFASLAFSCKPDAFEATYEPDVSELIEKYVARYGEHYRPLFEDAIPWWRQMADRLKLQPEDGKPDAYDWDSFVESLVARAVLANGVNEMVSHEQAKNT